MQAMRMIDVVLLRCMGLRLQEFIPLEISVGMQLRWIRSIMYGIMWVVKLRFIVEGNSSLRRLTFNSQLVQCIESLAKIIVEQVFMHEQKKKKKKRGGKHRPKGMLILHEDRDIVVVDKAPGFLTMGTDREKFPL